MDSRAQLMNKISFLCLLGMIFLLPFFVLPFFNIVVSKGLLFTVGILLSAIFWIVGRMIDAEFTFPKSYLLWAGLGLVFTSFLATIFSSNPSLSFIGHGFNVDTFIYTLLFFIAFFLSTQFFNNSKRIFQLFLTFLLSFVIIALFSLFVLFFGHSDFLKNSFLVNIPTNIVGSLNNLAIFSGLVIILSLITLESLEFKKIFRFFLFAILIIALFFLALANFSFIWLATGLFALFLFICKLSFQSDVFEKKAEDEKSGKIFFNQRGRFFPTISLIVVLICLVFVVGSGTIGKFVPNFFNVKNVEFRPSLGTTWFVDKEVLSQSPILGAGPGHFTHEWLVHKPISWNKTNLWNSVFDSGFGIIPTALITVGILGGLAWIFFLGAFLFYSIKALAVSNKDRISDYLLLTSLVGALFLWLVNFIFTPSIVLIALSFIMTGVFLGVLMHRKDIGIFKLQFGNSRIKLFFFNLLLVILLILSIWMGYIFMRKFFAITWTDRAVRSMAQNDLDTSEKYLLRSISLSPTDLSYRFLVDVYTQKLTLLLNSETKSSTEDAQVIVQKAEIAARSAVAYDSENYFNQATLGRLYEFFLSLGVQGSYESAISSYTDARNLNPKDPTVPIALARVEMISKNSDKVRQYLTEALQLKPDYIITLLSFSRFEKLEGNINAAIKYAEDALVISPEDTEIKTYLENLRQPVSVPEVPVETLNENVPNE
ncbi:hypothetical protein A3I25_00590 [Candidatus Nomurabacteria bacterium RIFCSPLOWO2_02_FULL_42_17]|uniref:Uncharacterized protein n=1 Tax=Candidatus Nomurabacteria bacterium RIFCSPLOWO2_02_FULL_42_17 TaxID=1801789 RepID=A0A1F6XPU5_9BACT|nr:MAG: hypothetical protein A3I25_00590 [Candidatus Nomurabacteria bacterium RIFCSPLOWO2_02_FULL_42_17]